MRVAPIEQLIARSRRIPLVIMGLMLCVLGVAIFLTIQLLRERIQEQIIGRDGAILHAVARMHADQVAEDTKDFGGLEDPGNQLLVLLQTSELADVMGTRLYDTKGQFQETFPPTLLEASLDLSPDQLDQITQFKPVTQFQHQQPLMEIFYPDSIEVEHLNKSGPILLVNVPLTASQAPQLHGIIQFIVDGHAVAAQFKALDWNLYSVGIIIFLASSVILLGVTGWSMQRIRQNHAVIEARTSDLIKANQELALVARTSAVGALTSHLIHGLKNPLSGIQNFVRSLEESSTAQTKSSAWQEAIHTTQRMQEMIQQVVTVLKEQEQDNHYEVTTEELLEIVQQKLGNDIRNRNLKLNVQQSCKVALSNRTANLVILILINLVQNAMEASASEDEITLNLQEESSQLIFAVIDHGPGIPQAMTASLFSPGTSTKELGSGIGLPISKQLAAHLGGELTLKENSPDGCVFELKLPKNLPSDHSEVANSSLVS